MIRSVSRPWQRITNSELEQRVESDSAIKKEHYEGRKLRGHNIISALNANVKRLI